jgi:hypothetical protein
MEMVNSIIKSTNELLPLLRENTPINRTIHNTISDILRFLYRVIEIMPDILISEKNNQKIKVNLEASFDRVLAGWNDFIIDKGEFFEAWEEFCLWWEEFERALKGLKEKNSTIYLSMN